MDPGKSTPDKPTLSMGLSQSAENDTDLDDDTQAMLDMDEKHNQIDAAMPSASHIDDGNDIDVTTTVYLYCKQLNQCIM